MTAEPSLPAAEQWFRQQLTRFWPVALGSLSLRRSPCIRPQCHACQTGEQHPSYVLYVKVRGCRHALYVPDDLAPQVRRALAKGRALQHLLQEAGQRYLEALKHERGRGPRR
jgi:hypothetical protein